MAESATAEVIQLFEITELKCCQCKQTKVLSEFSRNRNKKRGYSYRCSKCSSINLYEKNHIRASEWIISHSEHTCPKCKITKPISEFHRNERKFRGIDNTCKLCGAPGRKVAREKFWKKNGGRDGYKSTTWDFKKTLYGITKEQFYQKLSEQQGACSICRITPIGDVWKVYHVDHNHLTGQVRGLLCGHCNRGLGQFKDSITAIKNASQYLEKWGSYGDA